MQVFFTVIGCIISCLTLAQGSLQWVISEKVTHYGQTVTLRCLSNSCNIENCKYRAGWDRYDPDRMLTFAVTMNQTVPATNKYFGQFVEDGFTLEIRNLSKRDINISYECSVSFNKSEAKYLTEQDVFKDTMKDNDKQERNRLSERQILGIFFGVSTTIVIIVMIIVLLISKRNRRLCFSSSLDDSGSTQIKRTSDYESERRRTDEKREMLLPNDITDDTHMGMTLKYSAERGRTEEEREMLLPKERGRTEEKREMLLPKERGRTEEERAKILLQERNAKINNMEATQINISSEYISELDAKIDKMKLTIRHQLSKIGNDLVQTQAFETTLKLVKKNNYVVIGGRPGDGKTILAYRVLAALLNEGTLPLEVYTPNDWETIDITKEGKHLAIFIDNMFGEFSVSNVIKWCSQFKSMEAATTEDRFIFLIIVIRNDIFNQCKSRMKNDNIDFLNNSKVDISFGSGNSLTNFEIETFLKGYAPELVDNIQVEKFKRSIPELGFPLVCRLYKYDNHFKNRGIDFFENPNEMLVKEIELRMKDKDMVVAVLGYILLNGGKVDQGNLKYYYKDNENKSKAMAMLDIKPDITAFTESVKNAQYSFISMDKSGKYKFSHSSIQTATLSVLCEKCPHILIQQCHYNMLPSLEQRLLSLNDPNYFLKEFAERLFSLVHTKTSNSIDTYDIFVTISKLDVWDKREFLQYLQEDFLSSLVETLDKEKFTMFVHLAATGRLQLIQVLSNKVSDEQKLFALQASCEHNQGDVFTFLLQNNVKPDIICACRAAKGGFLDILEKLNDLGLDLTEISETQTPWILQTTVLEEVILFNHLHLIDSLLVLCPKLKETKSSIGGNILHMFAELGDIERMKSAIAEGFSPYEKTDIGSTILHFASQENRFDAVKYIIETYPDLLSVPFFTFKGGHILSTPVQSGNLALFKYMKTKLYENWTKSGVQRIELQDGCYIQEDERKTVIDITDILKIQTVEGYTLLHLAGSIEMFEWLINEGLNVHIKNNKGENVIEMAERVRRFNMIGYLKEKYPDL